MSLHIFGIRHHGPGSARSLGRALNELQPDAILVEGPPDADKVLPLLLHSEMKPPVALLIYAPDRLQQAVYYPFAVFSPEWQALHYGLSNNIPVRFMDLPQSHQLGMPTEKTAEEQGQKTQEETDTDTDTASDNALRHDPLSWLAKAAGYGDGELWWEHVVEQRRDSTDLFAAILEAMTALRTAVEERGGGQLAALEGKRQKAKGKSNKQQTTNNKQQTTNNKQQTTIPNREARREAYMRQKIRAVQKEGFGRIAVVCGAWHAPALQEPFPTVKADKDLLTGLSKVKVEATWVPWTYGRLAMSSGYGAGIQSPGWYHHLWTAPTQVAIRWISLVVQLLRKEDLDASCASAIEAVRLAETLAALRDRPLPGLLELNEAVLTVFCFGNQAPMQLIRDRLIVSDRLGEVPDETPTVPLQKDLQKLQKRLRLKPEPTVKNLELDLRKPNDLERSYLLHRLNLLGIPWGKIQQTRGTGTFKEGWRLQWHPEFAVNLIEAGIWGNTVYDATTACSCDLAEGANNLPVLTDLLEKVLLAALPDAVSYLMTRLQAEAAVASDVAHLMAALPPLAKIMRYSDVRQTDTATVSHVIDGLIARICIGLPVACVSLNDEAAATMYDRIVEMNSAVKLLQNQEHLNDWYQVLAQMADQSGLHGLLAGRCCRLLLDGAIFSPDEAARRMGLALSTASEPPQAAAWVEGFLKGSGLLLLHDDGLWQVLDSWVTSLPKDTFMNLLPLLRRTFSSFSAPERRQMGQRVRTASLDGGQVITQQSEDEFDRERADTVLPIVAQLLGHQNL